MKQKKSNPNGELRFTNLSNVDYASIFKSGQSVLELNGDELEGKTWREFQIYLGERLPINLYSYQIKFKGDAKLFTGRIRSVKVGAAINIDKGNNMSDDILKEFKTIKDQLAKATTSGGVSFEMLLASTKQGYEAQATYLNQKITDLNTFINELKLDIKELENDLTDCEKENAKSSGLAQYLAIGERVAQIYLGGKTKTPVSLKESNTSDIPAEILQVLGVINWTLIDPESTTRIANSIQQYLSVLPKEYFKGQ